jgi:predicted DNA-binding protein (MmcQ/YjbR family)
MLSHWTISPERLERLRGLCLGLPDATEKVAWGDPTWRVRERIFAMQKGNYEGGRPALWLKGAPGAQDALVGARPSVFFVPPYVGNKGWVGIYLDGASLQWDVIADLIVESWRLIAGPRLAAQLPEAPLAKRTSRTRAAKKKAPARKATPVRHPKKRTGAKR